MDALSTTHVNRTAQSRCILSSAILLSMSFHFHLISKIWTVADRLRVGIFAAKDVAQGTELSFDYQVNHNFSIKIKFLFTYY